MFRVVPDQLKISEGWVRCGHCAEVFDASAHLSDESMLEAPAVEEPTRPAEIPATIPAELPTRPSDVPRRDLPPRPAPSPVAEPADRSSESSSFFGPESQPLEPSPLDTPFVFRPSEFVRRDASDLPEEFDVQHEVPGEERHVAPEDLPDVSFVRKARRKTFWKRPTVRIGLALLSLVLAAALVVQLAYQDRDRLALAEPALRPWLERMCEPLACRLGPPRQIESIVIESSGFNRLRSDTYRLAFTLRNTSAVQVAAPAMELTITDPQDQPIARRVITPDEIGSPGEVIQPGTEWARSLGIVVNTPPSARVAGYRLLAFYP